MKISQSQLRQIINEEVGRGLRRLSEVKPPEGTRLSTRAPAAAALAHPAIDEAVDHLIGAMAEALTEQFDDDAMNAIDASLFTEFHKDLYDVIDSWMNAFFEEFGEN